jgi:hypothetical protein
MSLKRQETARQLAQLAERRGNKEAYDLALSAAWDFEYAYFADARGDHNKAWSKRSSANRCMKKARVLLDIGAKVIPS